MSKNEWKKWLGALGRVLLAYALVLAQGAWAGQDQKAKDNAASPQKAAAEQAREKQPPVATSAKAQTEETSGEASESAVGEEKPSRDGSHQGIKVHGHWTIEVRNPDGTLVRHREFENAYVQIGGALPPILAHQSVGAWAIGYCTPPGAQFCSSLQEGRDLTVSAPASGVNAGQFVLSGSATAGPGLSSIAIVSTNVVLCANTVAPLNCGLSGGGYQFTSATLSAPVPVSVGQTIAVTVVISFS